MKRRNFFKAAVAAVAALISGFKLVPSHTPVPDAELQRLYERRRLAEMKANQCWANYCQRKSERDAWRKIWRGDFK